MDRTQDGTGGTSGGESPVILVPDLFGGEFNVLGSM